jgi:hypothetical protein
MATVKISALTAAGLPLDADSLLEISQPTGTTPPYDSRKLPVIDLLGYYRHETPTSGATIALDAKDFILIIDPVVALASLTLTMAVGIDKKRVKICTRKTIDALTIDGGTVDWTAGNQFPAQGHVEFIYITAITTWVRIG